MKIVVAMSGGVDSSVAALLLKEQGHEVLGVSLRLAPDDAGSLQKREGRCCSVDDMTDARQVCDKLDIPFYAIDSRDKFKSVVFDPFVKAYRAGHTVKIHQDDGTTVVKHFTLEDGAVIIEPDVREYFPDDEAVNNALRCLIPLMPKKRKTKAKA